MLRSIAKSFLPPIVLKSITGFFYGWSGNYSSFADAVKKSKGYNQQIILDKVANATRHVRNSSDCYERDGVIFNDGKYHFPLISALSYIRRRIGRKVALIDFGGSLGSLYWQHRGMMVEDVVSKWNIVEQKHFVELGKNEFENDILKFHPDIKSCRSAGEIDLVILSSVLQYLEDPDSFLDELLSLQITYLFIDRTAFTASDKNRLTVQKVHPSIYKGSYPCWFLSHDRFMSKVQARYNVVLQFDSVDNSNLSNTFFKGLFLELKK